MMTELNQELRSLREEAKETNHHKQVLEKQVLKLQEDFEYLTSKYETLKDAEMVSNKFFLAFRGIIWNIFIC